MLSFVSVIINMSKIEILLLTAPTQMLISVSYCYRAARLVFNYNLTESLRTLSLAKHKFNCSEGSLHDIAEWTLVEKRIMATWWVRNRQWITQRRLVMITFIDLFLCTVVSVSIGLVSDDVLGTIEKIIILSSLPHNMFALVMGCMTYRFKNDSLKIKRELKLMGIIAIIGTLGIPIGSMTGKFVDVYHIPVFYGMFTMVLIAFVAIFLPLFHTFTHEDINKNMKSSNLKLYLKEVRIRNEFCSFLAKEFSTENLEFYEAVQFLLESLTVDSNTPDQYMTVRKSILFIMNTYIGNDAIKQINISSNVVTDINVTFNNNDTPDRENTMKLVRTLQMAADEVMYLMQTDSFPRFIQGRSSTTKNLAEENMSNMERMSLKEYRPNSYSPNSPKREDAPDIIIKF